MKTLAIMVISILAMAGCAGSAVGTLTAKDAKHVSVGGTEFVVSQLGPNTYAVAHRDYFAHNSIVPPSTYPARKAAFIAAIETATGCKVVDTVLDPGGPVLQGSVKC